MASFKPKGKVFVVGIVGGIGSGKSYLARLFQSRGSAVIDADQLGHEVLTRPMVARQLSQLFGQQILAEDGTIQRRELAKLVFGDDTQSAERLAQLEAIVHPQIHAEAVRQLGRYAESESPPKAIVIDAPLLLEADWAPMCDIILFLDTKLAVRQQRALERSWTLDQFEQREKSQLGLDAKRQAATHIIDGSLDRTELTATVDRLLAEMR